MELTSIIIVTHNQLEFTRLCVESIARHTSEPYELVFIDNGWVAGAESSKPRP
jgi:GT2 family glycosyltransferase